MDSRGNEPAQFTRYGGSTSVLREHKQLPRTLEAWLRGRGGQPRTGGFKPLVGQMPPTLNNICLQLETITGSSLEARDGREARTYLEVEGVQGSVRRAVDGSLRGELQGVEEPLTLDAEGAAQLKQRLADVAGAVVHQLHEEITTCIRRIQAARSSNTHLL